VAPLVFRCLAIVVALALATGASPRLAQAVDQTGPDLQITSKFYIVIDAGTGEIFASRGAHERAAMASLTKMFTAIEGIEAAEPGYLIETKPADIPGPSATTMGFGPGETFSFQDLLYGMMLPSGNDAARAIARDLGYQPGDTDQEAVDRFLGRINQRVKDMGLTDTNLVTPDGWGVPGHHSSVYDLAAFTMYALQYPRYVDAFSAYEYVTDSGQYLSNTNRMLNLYDGIVGGKTGFDFDAGYCLIEVAERNGTRMISVTLDGVAPDDWYDDNRVLLDYAFAQEAAGNRRQPVAAGVVAFKDPDAAFIAKNSVGGASLGVPAAAPAAVVQPLPVPAIAPTATSGGSNTRTIQLLAALGVAALLIAARVVAAIAHPVPAGGTGRRGTRLVVPRPSLPRPGLRWPTLPISSLRRTTIGKTRLPRRRR